MAATYDGRTSALYINGRRYQSQTSARKKAVMPIAFPVKVGGHGGLFRGAVDNFRMYRPRDGRGSHGALPGANAVQPHAPPRKVAGTIDGMPYSGCGRGGSWAVIPLRRGAIRLSNTGEMELWGVSSVNPSNQFDYLWPIGVLGQPGQNERYYREASGNIAFRFDGTARLELAGRTGAGLEVRQLAEVNARDEVRVRYQFASGDFHCPRRRLTFTQHPWASALRFVGHDDRGLITGNMMDLDGELWFRDLLEVNLVSSDNRLVVNLGPQTRLHVKGSRDPSLWLNGYTSFPGEIIGDGRAWGQSHRAVVEATFQLEADDLPCRLDRRQAREVTAGVPFDFGRLYQPDPARLGLTPRGRDAPIFMDDETVIFDLRVPKTLQASCKRSSWTLADADTGVELAGGEADNSAIRPGVRLKPGVYVLGVQGRDAARHAAGRVPDRTGDCGRNPPAEGPGGRGAQTAEGGGSGPDRFRPRTRLLLLLEPIAGGPRAAGQLSPHTDLPAMPGGTLAAGVAVGRGRRLVRGAFQDHARQDLRSGDRVSRPAVHVGLGVPGRAQGGCGGRQVPAHFADRVGPLHGQFSPARRQDARHADRTFRLGQPWVAACWQNAHSGRPSGKELDPACTSRMTLYEVQGELPALDAPFELRIVSSACIAKAAGWPCAASAPRGSAARTATGMTARSRRPGIGTPTRPWPT